MKKGFLGSIGLAVIIVAGLICVAKCSVRVPAGYVAVEYKMNGGISNDTLSQGWHLISPTVKTSLYSIGIDTVNFTSISTDDETQAAIQKKVNAQQELELANIEAKTAKVQADKDKEVALIAAEQDKEKAAIEAEQAKITAEGKAEATRIKADAEAEANKKIAESLTPELIEKQKIDKWNGDVPKVQGGNAATIVDAGELTSGNVATVENK